MQRKFGFPDFDLELESLIKHDWVDFITHNNYSDIERNHRHKFDEKCVFEQLDESKEHINYTHHIKLTF